MKLTDQQAYAAAQLMYISLAIMLLTVNLNWITWALFPWIITIFASLCMLALTLDGNRIPREKADPFSPYDVGWIAGLMTIVAIPVDHKLDEPVSVLGAVLIAAIAIDFYAWIRSNRG